MIRIFALVSVLFLVNACADLRPDQYSALGNAFSQTAQGLNQINRMPVQVQCYSYEFVGQIRTVCQ